MYCENAIIKMMCEIGIENFSCIEWKPMNAILFQIPELDNCTIWYDSKMKKFMFSGSNIASLIQGGHSTVPFDMLCDLQEFLVEAKKLIN